MHRRPRPSNIEIRVDDPVLTGHVGLLVTGELAARTDLVARLDRAIDAVRPFKQRRQGAVSGTARRKLSLLAQEIRQRGVSWLPDLWGVDGRAEPVWRLGLPKVRFHDLRHACSSLLQAGGISPKVVQEQLGHADLSMTLRYTQVLPELAEAAARRMEEVLADAQSAEGGCQDRAETGL